MDHVCAGRRFPPRVCSSFFPSWKLYGRGSFSYTSPECVSQYHQEIRNSHQHNSAMITTASFCSPPATNTRRCSTHCACADASGARTSPDSIINGSVAEHPSSTTRRIFFLFLFVPPVFSFLFFF